jgi:hypothetical protein
VTIRTGHYDKDELLTELNTNAPANYTWTYEDNNRFKITNDLAANFTFLPGELTDVLGYDSSSTYTGASSYEADYFPNLALNKDYFTLHSNILTRKRIHSYHITDGRSDIVLKIPNERQMGQTLTYEPEAPVLINVRNTSVSTLDFDLRDSSNSTLDIGPRSVIIEIERYP